MFGMAFALIIGFFAAKWFKINNRKLVLDLNPY
jgi:hypothetical protein